MDWREQQSRDASLRNAESSARVDNRRHVEKLERRIAELEAEIEYTLGAITPGEWRLVCSDPQDGPVIETDGEREVLGVSEWLRCEKPDIQFLGNAKGYVEYLLAENKKLREQLSPKVTEND